MHRNAPRWHKLSIYAEASQKFWHNRPIMLKVLMKLCTVKAGNVDREGNVDRFAILLISYIKHTIARNCYLWKFVYSVCHHPKLVPTHLMPLNPV